MSAVLYGKALYPSPAVWKATNWSIKAPHLIELSFMADPNYPYVLFDTRLYMLSQVLIIAVDDHNNFN